MNIEEKRNSVISLYKEGKKPAEIVKLFKNNKMYFSFVTRTIKRYLDTGSVKPRGGRGPKPTATGPAVVKKVRERLRTNPYRSGNKMAKELKISQTSIRRILKNRLKVKPYKIQKKHELTDQQKKVRLARVKNFIDWHERGGLQNVVFSDKKLFTVQQVVNKQNDRVYLQSNCSDILNQFAATRKQKPASVMVSAGITQNGKTPLVFLPSGVKINADEYINRVLEGCLKPWATKHFKNQPWVFQQDSAPAHKANKTVEWLKKNVPEFISPQQWPPNSPDLNPLDFCIWGILESQVCSTKHVNLESLQKHLKREWDRIPMNHIRAAYGAFFDRLKQIKQFKGGHIEN